MISELKFSTRTPSPPLIHTLHYPFIFICSDATPIRQEFRTLFNDSLCCRLGVHNDFVSDFNVICNISLDLICLYFTLGVDLWWSTLLCFWTCGSSRKWSEAQDVTLLMVTIRYRLRMYDQDDPSVSATMLAILSNTNFAIFLPHSWRSECIKTCAEVEMSAIGSIGIVGTTERVMDSTNE